jgi:hypothetical protein
MEPCKVNFIVMAPAITLLIVNQEVKKFNVGINKKNWEK